MIVRMNESKTTNIESSPLLYPITYLIEGLMKVERKDVECHALNYFDAEEIVNRNYPTLV